LTFRSFGVWQKHFLQARTAHFLLFVLVEKTQRDKTTYIMVVVKKTKNI
jgi:hypothetical protein